MQSSPTIDPAEVEYYQRLAKQWWDEQGKFWPLHRLNRLRTEYLTQIICDHFGRDPDLKLPLQELSIIDIGCGGGILSESMAKLGAQVTGIDITHKSLQVARRHSQLSQLDIDYRELTVEALVEQQSQFDVVLNMEVVEHVLELPSFMHSCTQLINPDGLFFVATINRNLWSWLIAIIGAEYVLGWLPRGTHRWSKFVKPSELADMMGGDGLTIQAEIGVQINPFNKRFSFTDKLHVNYMMAASYRRQAHLNIA